jgi:hypothetical protein
MVKNQVEKKFGIAIIDSDEKLHVLDKYVLSTDEFKQAINDWILETFTKDEGYNEYLKENDRTVPAIFNYMEHGFNEKLLPLILFQSVFHKKFYMCLMFQIIEENEFTLVQESYKNTKNEDEPKLISFRYITEFDPSKESLEDFAIRNLNKNSNVFIDKTDSYVIYCNESEDRNKLDTDTVINIFFGFKNPTEHFNLEKEKIAEESSEN